jgi:ATP-binding cassette, subfamily B, multidrug efflux pump
MMAVSLPEAGTVHERSHGAIRAHVLWRCYGYLRPYWMTSIGAYLALVGILALNLCIPQLVRTIIDRGIRMGDPGWLNGGVLALLLLALLKGIFTFLQGKWSETASQGAVYDLRNEIQRKLTQLSFSFHDRTETGELLSRAIQDVERIRFLTGRATLRLLEGVLLLAGTSGVLLWMNPPLALLVVPTMLILVYQALHFGRRFRPLSLKIQQTLAALTTRVEQNIRGMLVVKSFGQEQGETQRFHHANEAWFNLSATSGRLQAVNIPLLFLMANLGSVIILWFGGTLVVRSALTLGELVAFIAYVSQLIEPVRRLGMIIPAVAIASSAAERVFAVIDSITEVTDAPYAIPLPAIQGHVFFQDVSFSYGEREVLQEIQCEALPGQIIALLGPTGSGKTSLVNLIPRFYDPTSGTVLVDGFDLRKATINSLRSQIGIVLQETILFAATARENIVFGKPGCSDEEMIAAAKAAQAHEFILQMPQGYDTLIGERGVTLSGGQKQRVAIARALLMDPRILILDDATASIDAETERRIQIALERLMRGRTTFVIAHRLNTLRRADLILVMERGRIIARGTHQALIQESRLYRETYLRQIMSTDLSLQGGEQNPPTKPGLDLSRDGQA